MGETGFIGKKRLGKSFIFKYNFGNSAASAFA